MKEPQQELSTCKRGSESTVTHDEKMGGETLEEPVDCGDKVHMEGSFSEELVGGCNGKDIMVGVLGSVVYVDGVCTSGSGADLNGVVGFGGSIVGGKDVEPAGGTASGFEGSQDVSSLQGKRENETAELDGNGVTLKTLDEQKNIADRDEKSNLVGEQTLGISNVSENSNNVIKEVVTGAQVGVDQGSLNSEEKQCIWLEDCVEKERITGFLEAPLSADDQKSKLMKCVDQSVTDDATQVELDFRQNIDEQAEISEQVGSHGELEIEDEEHDDAEQQKAIDGEVIKLASMKAKSSGRFYQASYQLPTDVEGDFSVNDMVWGKVRSHPWWPGQIFDSSDASAKAMKHFKKDCYLVAYFGDRTFAWNEVSQLKPFRTHFSSIERQSNTETFQNAVDCALEEVTRRVEFGLACFCMPTDTYDRFKFQTVENAGIREELSFRPGVDESLNASSFSPGKLMEYLKTLSQFPTGGFDRLEFVIAKTQLLAFSRFKGYSYLPELQDCGDLDNDMDSLICDGEEKLSEVNGHATPGSNNDGQAGIGISKTPKGSSRKRKHNLKDGLNPKNKKRSLSELSGGASDSPDGDCWSDEKVTESFVLPAFSKKRSNVHYADEPGMRYGRKTISLAKVSNSSKQSFKIGECIRRVASQLTGSPSVVKSSGDKSQKTDGSFDSFLGNGSDVLFSDLQEAHRSSLIASTEYSSLDDLLSLLQWVAQEPQGDYSFLNVMLSFFSDFRNSIIVSDDSGNEILPTNKVGTKRKKQPIDGSPETFEFEEMGDTYWTDMVIQDGSEEKTEQPSQRRRRKDNQNVPAEPEKPVQVSRKFKSRKRYSDNDHAEAPEKPFGYVDENSPAELVLNFAELDSVPSETSLNKIFRRFGPLKESETEVDRVSSRARVVFKKCADAEVAFNSAKNFNIFGPILVNYQLNYTPSALFKASSVTTTQDQDQDMHLDLSNFEVNMV